MKRKKLLIIVGVVIVLVGIGVYSAEKKKEIKDLPKVNEKYLDYFKKNTKYENIITYTEEDINNDNEKDLLVVYKKNNRYNEMVGIISDGDKVYMTKPILAPQEDVVIEFKNIDNKGQMELILSGSKNGNVGYAIYRLEKDKLIDLFGEGMNSCC
ncbi:putative lipoprotein [[Clostridium] sordellii]|uniref:Cys-Cys-COOH (seleno)protein SaoC n=1 Tax=Paraclostridium sordellii TaxID=1505 RepID=UPI0005442286|nr:Cys-Cys-COOH (seleno)protein SaoC [Paeniclostridium sordellii]CEK31535.1 putative lipoprotein [[Clostridium] sordellii] [Paeniclostridium sordellii]